MTRTSKQASRTRDITRIHHRIDHWRRTRGKQRAMPEELWMGAAEVARKHGINIVAKELHLNPTSLKKRVESTQKESELPGFVEVDLSGSLPGSDGPQAEIEFEDESGSRMTISTRGDRSFDVMALAREFWSRGR